MARLFVITKHSSKSITDVMGYFSGDRILDRIRYEEFPKLTTSSSSTELRDTLDLELTRLHGVLHAVKSVISSPNAIRYGDMLMDLEGDAELEQPSSNWYENVRLARRIMARLSELTQHSAPTIHALLQQFWAHTRNRLNDWNGLEHHVDFIQNPHKVVEMENNLKLRFYIFREPRKTVYIIVDTETCRYSFFVRDRLYGDEPRSRIAELNGLVATYVRLMRCRRCYELPTGVSLLDFKAVRKLLTRPH